MKTNDTCSILPKQKLVCDDIYMITKKDPYWDTDRDFVCDKAKKYDFTNNDLANLINFKFNYYESLCTVYTINDAGTIQLRKQCPDIYNHYYDKVSA